MQLTRVYRCAMRSGSRLLSGASMEDGSVLSEHSLLISGEVAESRAIYVGWPARNLTEYLAQTRACQPSIDGELSSATPVYPEQSACSYIL